MPRVTGLFPLIVLLAEGHLSLSKTANACALDTDLSLAPMKAPGATWKL